MMKTHIILLLALTVCAGYILLPYSARAQAPVPQELLEDAPKAPKEPEQIQPIPGTIDPRLIPTPDAEEKNKRALPFKNYSDIPDEALADMQDFHKECEAHYDLSAHYDCECLSSRYLEERIKAGPNESRQQLTMKLSGECFNIPGAAGRGFDRCQASGSLNYNGGMSPTEYCECVGRNYAILVQRTKGGLNRRKINSIMSSALLRCRASTPSNKNIFKRLDNTATDQVPVQPR